MKLYGVTVPCDKGCHHLISIGKTYLQAWSNAPPKYAALDGATTIRIGANSKAVIELRRKLA